MANEAEALVERLLSIMGGERSKESPFLRCCVGDKTFKYIVQRLKYRLDHIVEIERKNERKQRKSVDSLPLTIEQRQELLENHDEFIKYLEPHLGLDYEDSLKEQLTRQVGDCRSFRDIQFQLSNCHAHACSFLEQVLSSTGEPITIVRVDAHKDTKPSFENVTNSGNYLSQVLLNPKFKGKIKRVIDIGGLPFCSPLRFSFQDIPFIGTGAFSLPEVLEPSVIDIDLDGCEVGFRLDDFNEDRSGGHIYQHSSFEYYNQNNIKTHPTFLARMLKTQVKNPLAVSVALERGFRNRLFWYRIEHDFLEELGK